MFYLVLQPEFCWLNCLTHMKCYLPVKFLFCCCCYDYWINSAEITMSGSCCFCSANTFHSIYPTDISLNTNLALVNNLKFQTLFCQCFLNISAGKQNIHTSRLLSITVNPLSHLNPLFPPFLKPHSIHQIWSHGSQVKYPLTWKGKT